MNQLPRHLGAHPSMILMCFFSLLSTSNQEHSLVFSPPRNVTCTPPHLSSIPFCSITGYTSYHLLKYALFPNHSVFIPPYVQSLLILLPEFGQTTTTFSCSLKT